jgi:hypothetical protein
MDFRITGLARAAFEPLFALSDEALLARNIRRYVVDGPGFPCRISLADAPVGERVILVSHTHQPADSPYRAAGPVFVREAARETYDRVGEVPEALRTRLLSLRAYNDADCIRDADVVEGKDVEAVIGRLFGAPETAYLHAHFARFGCYACRIDRA